MALLTGLTTAEVRERQSRLGRNEIPPPKRPSRLWQFVSQITHFFAIMLWVAAGLAFIAGLPELGIAVIAVILINAVFAFIQERRADRAAERLFHLLPRTTTVFRDGRLQVVEAVDVVVDDVISLEAGDHIPADAVVDRASALQIDTSVLTGESLPARVGEGDEIFAGCFVVDGSGTAIVTKIGSQTRIAGITSLTASTVRAETPLTQELKRLVRIIAIVAVAVGSLFLVVSLLLGIDIRNGVTFAIGVTVALVPEALLPTVTLTLAWSAERMAKRNALVRRLDALETLGATTYICTDKTGTLTLNQMTVVAVWTPTAQARCDTPGYAPNGPVRISGDPREVNAVALAANNCSDGYVFEEGGAWLAHGDPMEAAINAFVGRLDLDFARPVTEQVRHRFPFDPQRRRMSVVINDHVFVKGAPDAIISKCIDAPDISPAMTDFTGEGLRVIGVAQRIITPNQDADTVESCETDLTFLGLMALEDPPRVDVKPTLEKCRSAGIRIAMVTGDHPETARAIADVIGLRKADSPVLLGHDLPTSDEDLAEVMDQEGVVVARVAPEEKHRIARVLRTHGHVVAMTGDGVNDVPALREANIGVAMGKSGSDIAREVADLVLLDDRFESIVEGIEQGRRTFVNIRRFLTYHLTDNVAELTPLLIWALSGGQFPLALGVLQILALDIGTDTLSAVALGAEPASRNMLAGPPVRGRLLNKTVALRAFAIQGPTIALFTMIAFSLTILASGASLIGGEVPSSVLLAASGAAFMTVVLGQIANAFACRSTTQPINRIGWLTNRFLLVAIGIDVIFALATIYVGPLATALGQSGPTVLGWLIALLTIPAVFAVDLIYKRIRNVGFTSVSS